MEHVTPSLLEKLRVIALKTLELQDSGVAAHTKPDQTVVSKADLFVQCAIVHYLQTLTPKVPVLAEETPEQLRHNDELRSAVNHQLKSIGIESDAVALLERSGHQRPGSRYWCLDPIDGTRGFLRGDHYAIALALVNNGKTEHGFLCCPRLTDGGIILASEGGKVTGISLSSREAITPHSNITNTPVLVESLEMGPTHESFTRQFKTVLDWSQPTIRMDSQSKYGALVLGDAHCYVRLPRHKEAVEYAWDHAAGAHLVQLAGGRVSDLNGKALDFSPGAQLVNNRGVLATMKLDHDSVLKAIQQTQRASI